MTAEVAGKGAERKSSHSSSKLTAGPSTGLQEDGLHLPSGVGDQKANPTKIQTDQRPCTRPRFPEDLLIEVSLYDPANGVHGPLRTRNAAR